MRFLILLLTCLTVGAFRPHRTSTSLARCQHSFVKGKGSFENSKPSGFSFDSKLFAEEPRKITRDSEDEFFESPVSFETVMMTRRG